MPRISLIFTTRRSRELGLNASTDILFCRIDPPLIYCDQSIFYIHQALVTNTGASLVLDGVEFSLDTSVEEYKLTMLSSPLLLNQPECLNQYLKSEEEESTIILFLQEHDRIGYFGILSIPWNHCKRHIISLIEERHQPGSFISVRRYSDNVTAETMTEFESLTSFFHVDSYEEARKFEVLIICAQPDLFFSYKGEVVTTVGLPNWPKSLISLAVSMDINDPLKLSLRRKFFATAINGGMPLDILEALEIPIPGQEGYFQKVHFSQVTLNLRKVKVVIDLHDFDLVFKNFASYIDSSSSEASLCINCWYLIINTCLKELILAKTHKLEYEHHLDKILPGHSNRRIDGIIRLGSRCKLNLTFVIIEAGKSDIVSSLQHKDSSKVLGLVSAVCIHNAYELSQVGVDPLHARAYGLLIGGTKAQLCIAHPELIETGDFRDGKPVFEIHAHVSMSEHWIIDLLSDDAFPPLQPGTFCEPGCCNNVFSQDFIDPIYYSQEVLEADWVHRENIAEAKFFNFEENLPEEQIESTELNGRIKTAALLRLKSLLVGICQRMEHLCGDPEEQFKDNTGRIYLRPRKEGLIVQSATRNPVTPESDRISYSNRKAESKESRKKTSKSKAALYRKLSFEAPTVFPLVLDAIELNNDMVELTLEPSINLLSAHFLFQRDDLKKSVISVTKLALDCAYGVYCLHKKITASFKGTLKAYDIGFSSQNGCWKFFNLDSLQVTEISDNDMAKDILALGGCLFDLLFLPLLDLCCNTDQKIAEVDSVVNLLQQIFLSMRCAELQYRASIEVVIKQLMKALEKLDPSNKLYCFDPVIASVKYLLEPGYAIEKVENLKLTEIQSPRIEENPDIPNIIQ